MRKKNHTTFIIDSLNKHYSMNNVQFASFLGIAPTTLSSWKDRDSIDYELIYSKCVDIDANWLLTGKGDIIRKNEKEKSVIMVSHEENGETIPLVNLSVVAGFGSADFRIEKSDVKAYYVVPKFKDRHIDFMIEVAGSSMYPKYNSGDVIACTIIKESKFIQWNKVHVIATHEQGLLVKRIREGDEDTLLAISDNPDYKPFKIPLNEITGIALVVGVIRLE